MGFNFEELLNVCERPYIDVALRVNAANLSHTSRLLGVNRTTLYSKIERLKRLKR